MTYEGNQSTVDVKPLQAGHRHRKGIFISCPILRAVIPVKVIGRFGKLRRTMLLSLDKYKSFCRKATHGVTLDGKVVKAWFILLLISVSLNL